MGIANGGGRGPGLVVADGRRWRVVAGVASRPVAEAFPVAGGGGHAAVAALEEALAQLLVAEWLRAVDGDARAGPDTDAGGGDDRHG